MSDYYNEHDPFAAAWLRELIAAGEIPAGDVDERSIEDVVPSDLVGYRHCHFFAGIGGWALAMRLADWPDDLPLWTGSCPCQPFSAAGQGAGFADERHLWPAFYWLIRQCRPRYVCGEQVASGDALRWWDLVATDLEGAGYACTAVDLPAASVGAPHKRSRLFWLADATTERHDRRRAGEACDESRTVERLERLRATSVVMADADQHGAQRAGRAQFVADVRWADGGVADTDGGHTSAAREQRSGQHGLRTASGHAHGAAGLAECADHAISMADTSDYGCCGRSRPERDSAGTGQSHACGHQPDGCGDAGDGMGDTRGAGSAEQRWRRDESSRLATASGADAWADLEWLPCTDGKARPTESRILLIPDELSDQLGYSRNARGTWTLSPLIQKTTNRAGRLRGYGNAIVPQAAAEVLRAWQAVMR